VTVFLSTGGFARDFVAEEIVSKFYEKGIENIEMGSGTVVDDLSFQNLVKLQSGKILLHNFVPGNEKSFVLNSSIPSEELLQFLRNAVTATKKLGGDIYSYHAGFLHHLTWDQLGNSNKQKRLPVITDEERIRGLINFANNHDFLIKYAGDDVAVIVENNCITPLVAKKNDKPPSLFVTPFCLDEIEKILKKKLAVLFDVAHAKVSANSYGFDQVKFLQDCWLQTRMVHLSDNDGLYDSNDGFDEHSWFIEPIKDLIKRTAWTPHFSIEVYDRDISYLKELYEYISQNFA
jgi:sugar phosphate isomerase/epimerase